MGKWMHNSAKFIGLSHVDENLPCQDSVMTLNNNDVYSIVLSDGCGSAPFSDIGSDIVVNTVCNYLCDNFDILYSKNENEIKIELMNLILDSYIQYSNKHESVFENYLKNKKGKRFFETISNYEIMKLLSEADRNKLSIASFLDATVLFVCIKDDKCLIGHCGDGFILGYKNNNFNVLSEEKKEGERNVTNYPSSVYFLSKALNDIKILSNFRILKLNSNEYLGYTIMSDGAEKSLIKIENGIPTARLNNNLLLYEIISNETPGDASEYILSLLEKVYRERKNDDGELIEITDDDVSVAILLSNEFSLQQSADKTINSFEHSENKKTENITDEKNIIDFEKKINDICLNKFYGERLKMLLIDRPHPNYNKFDWVSRVFDNLISKNKGKYTLKEFKSILRKKMARDDDDVKLIIKYGKKCGVIVYDNRLIQIKCDGDINDT